MLFLTLLNLFRNDYICNNLQIQPFLFRWYFLWSKWVNFFTKKEPGSLTRPFVSLLLFVGISFKRKHNVEIKTSIFYLCCQMSLIFLNGMEHALHSISVISVLRLCRKRKSILKLHFSAHRIDYLQHQKALSFRTAMISKSLFFSFAFQLSHRFNCVIQSISKQCIQIYRIHKSQQRSICHTVDMNPAIFTDQTFFLSKWYPEFHFLFSQ